MGIILGADPEYFAGYEGIDENGVSKLYCQPPVIFRRSGLEFVPNRRHPIFYKENGIILHEDGAAFEMAVEPQNSWEKLFDKIEEGRKALQEVILSKFTTLCDGVVHVIPTIDWEVGKWSKENREFRFCTEFGCDPDYDAFEMSARCRIVDASKHPKRYGGGHIHISGSKAIKERPVDAIHSLALTAGLAGIAYSDVPDLEHDRMYLYGKPGKFRIQEYGKLFKDIPDTDMGVEYRTLSNRWTGNKDLASKVFHWAEIGIHDLLEKGLLEKLIGELREPTVQAIVNCDQKAALEVLRRVENCL